MDAAIRKRIYDFIEEKGLRKTVQRDAIIEAAFSTNQHYTAEELLAMARKNEPSVSRATVYRTLPLLVECGVLKEMDFGTPARASGSLVTLHRAGVTNGGHAEQHRVHVERYVSNPATMR